MSDSYPDDLEQRDYYDGILGPPQEDERVNDLRIRYVGEDKVIVERRHPDSEIEFTDSDGNISFGEVPF